MFTKRPKENMGKSDLGWLKSYFHFSFAQYKNPKNIDFGVLRVLNDDIVAPQSGFDTHPHANMEIISYVIDGELTHKDSMGNGEVLYEGEVQYMSAGDGIFHSEHNHHQTKNLRLLQIWIRPPSNDLPKQYGSYKYKQTDAKNQLLQIVSNQNGNSQIKIYQDVNIFVSQLEKNQPIIFELGANRQMYFVLIQGRCQVGDVILEDSDGCEIYDEAIFEIRPLTNAHFLIIEMAKYTK